MYIFLCYSRYNLRHAHSFFFLSIHKIVWYLMAIDKSIENYTSNWFTTPEMILSGNSEQMLAAPQICVIVCYRIQSLNISIYFVFYYWAFRLYERSILFNKIRLCIPMNINFLPIYWDGEQWAWFQVNLDCCDYAIDLLLLY